MAYKLSGKAEEDVFEIFERGEVTFGLDQAERYHEGLQSTFSFLAQFPGAARERRELRPGIRMHPYRAHLIVYRLDGEDILIQRVRHGREDWAGSPTGD